MSDQFEEQDTVGNGELAQPGADGAPLDEDYGYEPEQGPDDLDDEDPA